MKVFLGIMVCVLIVCLIVCIFFTYLCIRGGKSKLYCKLCNRDEWFGWEKVIENIDSVRYIDRYTFDFYPKLNSYNFSLNVDGTECKIIYWDFMGDISVHDFPGIKGGCLCGFDKYHTNLVKNIIIEKFGLE